MINILDKISNKKISSEKIFLILFIAALSLLILVVMFVNSGNNAFLFNQTGVNEFSLLANSFLHGRVDFMQHVSQPEVIDRGGKEYWPMPPLPAILLAPFTLLLQQALDIRPFVLLANLLVGLLIYLIANRKFSFSKLDSIWLTIFYLFSGPYILNLFSIETYYNAHVITTIFLFAALWEYFGKKRYALIGFFGGLILLTRFTASLSMLFFVLVILFNKDDWRQKLHSLWSLFWSSSIGLLILLSYNYLRFQDFFENGYLLARGNISNPPVAGLFSWRYLINNTYHYFLNTFSLTIDSQQYINNKTISILPPYLKGDYRGSLSFLLTAPLYLYLLTKKFYLRNKEVVCLLLTSLTVLLVLLCYYYNGWPQVGPRYLNDFLPLLFIALLWSWPSKKLLFSHKLLIVFMILLNIYLLLITLYFRM